MSRFERIKNSKYPTWEEEILRLTTCRHSNKNKCETCTLRDDDPHQFYGCKCDDYMAHDTKCWVYLVALQCYRYLENPENKINMEKNKELAGILLDLDTKSKKSINEFVYCVSVNQRFDLLEPNEIDKIKTHGYQGYFITDEKA